MRSDIRPAYRVNPPVLGIFPAAAHNGGPRNVTKLYRVPTRMKVNYENPWYIEQYQSIVSLLE